MGAAQYNSEGLESCFFRWFLQRSIDGDEKWNIICSGFESDELRDLCDLLNQYHGDGRCPWATWESKDINALMQSGACCKLLASRSEEVTTATYKPSRTDLVRALLRIGNIIINDSNDVDEYIGTPYIIHLQKNNNHISVGGFPNLSQPNMTSVMANLVSEYMELSNPREPMNPKIEALDFH